MLTADFSNAVDTKDTGEALLAKDWDCEIKSLDEQGRFAAYFAAFNNVDRGGDVIEPGAFKNLDEFSKDGWIGVNHQMDLLPVAYPLRVVQDNTGLYIEGKFHSTPDAQAVRTVVKERMDAGKAVKGSIGYKVIDSSPDYRDGQSVRKLKGVNLYEASFVNLPMNPHAQVMGVKSMEVKGDSLNSAGASFAVSLISQGKVSDGSWSFDAADGNALLGDGGEDWATYGKVHLAVSTDSPEGTKGHYKYPFAKKVGGEIKLFVAALRAIRSRASQQEVGGVFAKAGELLEKINGKEEDKGDDVLEKKVLTLDELKDWIETQTKAGRVLSKGNLTRLREWHGALSTMCNQMKEFVDMHDSQEQEEDGGSEDKGKPVVPQEEQGPMGATTADIMKRREKALKSLRDRALKAQYQFALLPEGRV